MRRSCPHSTLFMAALALSMPTAPAAEHFQPSGQKWRHDVSAPVPYFINPGNWASDPNLPQIVAGIQKAFNEVSSQPHLKITFDYRGLSAALPGQQDGVSVVYLDHNRTYAPAAGVTMGYEVSAAGIINAADIALNGTTHASDPQTNLYALTLHELCHFLGLGHSSAGNDSAVYENTVNLQLSADDLSGLAALYPNPANPLASVTGTVHGRVTAADSTTLNARMVAWDGSKAQPRVITTVSASDGSFTLSGLPPGTYRILAESAGRPFTHLFLDDGMPVTVTAGGSTTLPASTVSDFGAVRLTASNAEETAVQQGTGLVFSSGGVYGPVRVVNPVSGAVVATIDTGADDLALTPDGSVLLTVGQLSRSLSAWDANQASPTFGQNLYEVTGLPAQPIQLTVRDNSMAYVSTNGGGAIVAVNLTTRTIAQIIQTNKYNQSLTISPDGNRLWAGAFLPPGDHILEIDINPQSPAFHTVVRTLPAGNAAAWIVRELAGLNLLAQGTRTGIDLRRADTGALVKSIAGGREVVSVFTADGGSRLCFLADDDPALRNTELWVVDVPSLNLIEKVPIGGDFLYAALQPDGKRVTISGENGIVVVAPRSFEPLSPGITPEVVQHPAAAIGGQLRVTAAAPGWTAASSAPWLKVNPSPHEETVGVIAYSLEANPGLHARTATITAGGFTALIAQAGAGMPPAFTGPATFGAVSGQPFIWTPQGRFEAATFTASGLPAGLSISSTTGGLSGTVSEPGTWDIGISATNPWGRSVQTLRLRVTSSPRPDLEFTSVRVISASSEEMNYEFTIRNAGTAPLAGNFFLERYLSADAAIGNDDQWAHGYTNQAYNLAPGESVTAEWTQGRFGTTASSHPFLILRLVSSEIAEASSDNNLLVFPPEGWTYALWAKYGTSFSIAQAGNPPVGGTGADPDGDGSKNWLEYAFGMDPLKPTDQTVLGTCLPQAGAPDLPLPELRFLLPTTPRSDVHYAVETAASLTGPWTVIAVRTPGGMWTGSATVRAGSITSTHSAWNVISSFPSGSSSFLRIRAAAHP